MPTTINLRDLDDTLVTEAKVAAAKEGVTLKEYTCRALRERIAAKQRATLPQDKPLEIRDTSTHTETASVPKPAKLSQDRPTKAGKGYDVGHSPRCQCIACRGAR